METTTEGWFIAFGFFTGFLLLKLLWLKWKVSKDRIESNFIKSIEESNSVDALLGLLSIATTINSKEMIKRKLKRITS